METQEIRDRNSLEQQILVQPFLTSQMGKLRPRSTQEHLCYFRALVGMYSEAYILSSREIFFPQSNQQIEFIFYLKSSVLSHPFVRMCCETFMSEYECYEYSPPPWWPLHVAYWWPSEDGKQEG